MKKMILKKEEIETVGRQIAEQLKPGDVISLIGNLGTGKTTLSQAICRGLGVEETITSPTFTIMQAYYSGRLPVFHFDVYRIRRPEEMEDIDYEAYFYGKGVCLVEWADLVKPLLPPEAITITLEYGALEETRQCTIENLDIDFKIG